MSVHRVHPCSPPAAKSLSRKPSKVFLCLLASEFSGLELLFYHNNSSKLWVNWFPHSPLPSLLCTMPLILALSGALLYWLHVCSLSHFPHLHSVIVSSTGFSNQPALSYIQAGCQQKITESSRESGHPASGELTTLCEGQHAQLVVFLG